MAKKATKVQQDPRVCAITVNLGESRTRRGLYIAQFVRPPEVPDFITGVILLVHRKDGRFVGGFGSPVPGVRVCDVESPDATNLVANINDVAITVTLGNFDETQLLAELEKTVGTMFDESNIGEAFDPDASGTTTAEEPDTIDLDEAAEATEAAYTDTEEGEETEAFEADAPVDDNEDDEDPNAPIVEEDATEEQEDAAPALTKAAYNDILKKLCATVRNPAEADEAFDDDFDAVFTLARTVGFELDDAVRSLEYYNSLRASAISYVAVTCLGLPEKKYANA